MSGTVRRAGAREGASWLHRLQDCFVTRSSANGGEIWIVLDPFLVTHPLVHGTLENFDRVIELADHRKCASDVVEKPRVLGINCQRLASQLGGTVRVAERGERSCPEDQCP